MPSISFHGKVRERASLCALVNVQDASDGAFTLLVLINRMLLLHFKINWIPKLFLSEEANFKMSRKLSQNEGTIATSDIS